MTKKLVELQTFIGESDVQPKFTGRLLGLLTEEEYAAIVSKPDTRRHLFSVETKNLADIYDATVEIDGKRLAMSVIEKDDTEAMYHTLFITNPLEAINSVIDSKTINLEGKGQTFYIIEEVTK